MLGGVIAMISAGDVQQINDLIHVIKTRIDVPQFAAHIRNGLRSSAAVAQAYQIFNSEMDGALQFPSSAQLLPQSPAAQSHSATSQHNEPLTTLRQGQDTKLSDNILTPYLEAMQELRRGLHSENTIHRSSESQLSTSTHYEEGRLWIV